MGSQLALSLLSGVLSGIIAAFLVFVVAHYWKKIILPWCEERVYKDVKISGEWRTHGNEGGQTFEETAKVYQNAHHIWGEIFYQRESHLITYEFEGEFRNLILTARYSVKAQHDLDRGTFTLMLRNNGKMLKGFFAWYVDNENDVVSGKYEWVRP